MDLTLDDDSFLPATLEFVRRCPARADYIELFFATDEGTWKWCFSKPPEQSNHERGPFALTMGCHGAQAHIIDHDGVGPALPSGEALPAILAGAEVYVARQLIARGL